MARIGLAAFYMAKFRAVDIFLWFCFRIPRKNKRTPFTFSILLDIIKIINQVLGHIFSDIGTEVMKFGRYL